MGADWQVEGGPPRNVLLSQIVARNCGDGLRITEYASDGSWRMFLSKSVCSTLFAKCASKKAKPAESPGTDVGVVSISMFHVSADSTCNVGLPPVAINTFLFVPDDASGILKIAE